jgi:hypothetical protein
MFDLYSTRGISTRFANTAAHAGLMAAGMPIPMCLTSLMQASDKAVKQPFNASLRAVSRHDGRKQPEQFGS